MAVGVHATPSQMRWPTALKPPVSESESASGNEAYYDAEEPPAVETPPIDQGANRADGYHTPPSGRAPAPAPAKKSGRKTRGGRSMKPLQPANRG